MKKFWRRETPSPGAGSDPSPDPVQPDLLAWAQAVDASHLSDQTVKQTEQYLRDYRSLHWSVRREFGQRLREAIAAQVSPPPPATVATLDVMSTALSARRRQLGIG